MSEFEAVLAANEAFYRAFASRDVARMERIWAERQPVACIHPGRPALRGRAAVLESWRMILQGPEVSAIRCVDAAAMVYGAAALVTCVEVINGAFLAATNTFVFDDGVWYLVHHHAGPIPASEARGGGRESEPTDAPVSVH